jgi:type II secretory pathway pseudopilin PulG
MILQQQRKAFSMLTAIFVIMIMASVGGMVMSLSGKMVKETTAQYQREQAMLLANSYTEYAVMAVMANDRNTNCLKLINGVASGFTVVVRIAYIGTSAEVNVCKVSPSSIKAVFSNTVSPTTKSPLNIVIDTYVKYKDFDHHDADNAPWITYHKRSLQKI